MRTLLLALLALPALAADKPAAFAPVTIPLTVMEGDLFNRDCRVFGVPVECAGVKSTFTWACGGETIVSDTFARQARLVVKDDPELAQYRDAAGNELFVGSAA